MNKHDSEHIAGMLEASGYRETKEVEDAGLIIFNTCSVREHADRRLFGHVASLKSLKEKRPDTIIVVAGCLAQSQRQRILGRFPHVDLVCGTHNLFNLDHLIEQTRSTREQVCQVWEEPGPDILEPPTKRESAFKAWLPIATGCDNHCSYCIVPSVRGKEISRPLEEILNEAKKLASDGVLEITLLGQNVNSYGRDLYGQPVFPELLKKVADVKGISRIRFTTSHPKDLSREMIKQITRSTKICRHIHLPFQAGSTRILKAMNRDYSKEGYLKLAKSVKDQVPGVSLTTDIMVGFPGETEQDFQDTLDLVERVRFDQAFTFIYSKREGTPAAEVSDSLSYEAKLERFQRLIEVQNRITLEENQKAVGQTLEVLVEGYSKKGGLLSGRTGTNKVVNFRGDSQLIGKVIPVNIESAHTWFLTGTAVS